jgi:hypothetical protein
VLVLHGTGLSLPLTVGLSPVTGLTLPEAFVTRTLGQATIGGGQADYRVRFVLAKVTVPSLQFGLPAPPSLIGLEVRLNGKRIEQVFVRDESGQPAAANSGRIVQIPLTAKPGPQVLEFRYQTNAGRRSPLSDFVISPPTVKGSVAVGPIYWQLGFPNDDILLCLDSQSRLQQRWAWRQYLFAPQPALSVVEMERWLMSDFDRGESARTEAPTWDAGAVIASSTVAPVHIVPIPRSLWLLSCSLAALLIGLALLFLRRVRWLFWLMLSFTAVSLGAAALFWPQTTVTAAIGSPLGLIILAVVVFIQWLLQRRYERRVVFMPGFTRRPSGSSRAQPSSRSKRREPSTVDAPPVA